MPISAKPPSIIDQSPELRPKSRPAVIRANTLHNMNSPRRSFYAPLLNRRLSKIAHRKADSADRRACYRHLRFELRIIGTSPTRGNDVAETALVGWGGRIRTWECSLQEHSSSLLLAPRSSAQSPEVAEIAALLSRRPISRAASMFDTGRSVALSFASAAA